MRTLLATLPLLALLACSSATEPTMTATDDQAAACAGNSSNCGHGFGKQGPPKHAQND
jgi:hypothetical protein